MCICLTETARVGGKEWYFYSQHDRKYASGLRTNRATVSGYWKATGKDKAIFRHGTLVGMRKTIVFYQGRAPKGRKTNWVMHEFRLEGPLALPKYLPPRLIFSLHNIIASVHLIIQEVVRRVNLRILNRTMIFHDLNRSMREEIAKNAQLIQIES